VALDRTLLFFSVLRVFWRYRPSQPSRISGNFRAQVGSLRSYVPGSKKNPGMILILTMFAEQWSLFAIYFGII
jgi:hypothetical protein